MNSELSNHELIEQYLSGSLPSDEAARVEQKINNDPDFAKEVDWMKTFQSAMKNPKRFEILDQIQVLHTRRRRRDRIKKLVPIAAVFLLLLVAFLLYPPLSRLSDQADRPSEEVPEQVSDPVVSKPAVADDWEKLVEFPDPGQQTLSAEADQRAQAIALYEQGNHLAALPLLESYLESLDEGDDDFDIRLLVGKIYLADQKKYQPAAAAFRAVLESDALPRFIYEARYYYALTEYAAGRQEEAREWFGELAAQAPGLWQKKAATALEELF